MPKKILSFAEVIIFTLVALYIFLFYSTRYVVVAIPHYYTPTPFFGGSVGDRFDSSDSYLKKIYGAFNDAYGKNGKVSAGAFTLNYSDFKDKIQSFSSYATKIYNAFNDAYGEDGSLTPGAFSLSNADFIKKIGHPDDKYDTTYTTTIYSWNEYKSITDFRSDSNGGIRSDVIEFKDIHVFFLSLKNLTKNQVTAYSFLFSIAIVSWIILIVFVFKIVYKLRIKQGNPSSA